MLPRWRPISRDRMTYTMTMCLYESSANDVLLLLHSGWQLDAASFSDEKRDAVVMRFRNAILTRSPKP
jgi:hypothetical protein